MFSFFNLLRIDLHVKCWVFKFYLNFMLESALAKWRALILLLISCWQNGCWLHGFSRIHLDALFQLFPLSYIEERSFKNGINEFFCWFYPGKTLVFPFSFFHFVENIHRSCLLGLPEILLSIFLFFQFWFRPPFFAYRKLELKSYMLLLFYDYLFYLISPLYIHRWRCWCLGGDWGGWCDVVMDIDNPVTVIKDFPSHSEWLVAGEPSELALG